MMLKFLVGSFVAGMTIFFWTAWYLDKEWRKINLEQRATIAKLRLESLELGRMIRKYEQPQTINFDWDTDIMWSTTKGDTQP